MKYHFFRIDVLLAMAVVFLIWGSYSANGFSAEAENEELVFITQDGQKLKGIAKKTIWRRAFSCCHCNSWQWRDDR